MYGDGADGDQSHDERGGAVDCAADDDEDEDEEDEPAREPAAGNRLPPLPVVCVAPDDEDEDEDEDADDDEENACLLVPLVAAANSDGYCRAISAIARAPSNSVWCCCCCHSSSDCCRCCH